MTEVHAIRLRGPWEQEVVSDQAGRRNRVTMPSHWAATLGTRFVGRVRYRRYFQRPTNLAGHQRVRLTCDGADPQGEVALNGRPLGQIAGYALPNWWDVTDLLQPRNELTVEIVAPAGEQSSPLRPGREHLAGGLIGEVRLEIGEGQFLWQPAIVVVGPPDRPEALLSASVAGLPPEGPLSWELWEAGSRLAGEGCGPGQQIAAQVSLPVDWPAWAAAQPQPVAAARSLMWVLLADGRAVWQANFSPRRVDVSVEAEPQALIVNGQRLSLPATWTDFPDEPLTVPGLAACLGQPAPPLVATRRILSPADYERLSSLGLGIVQQLPLSWAGAIAPTLAQWPAVLAWAAEPDQEPPAPTLAGRPFLSTNLLPPATPSESPRR